MKTFTCLVHSLGFAGSDYAPRVGVWTVEAPVPASCPERLFEATNHPEPDSLPGLCRKLSDGSAYSLSVGDVVEVCGEGLWLCAPSSWQTISREDFDGLRDSWARAGMPLRFWRKVAETREAAEGCRSLAEAEAARMEAETGLPYTQIKGVVGNTLRDNGGDCSLSPLHASGEDFEREARVAGFLNNGGI